MLVGWLRWNNLRLTFDLYYLGIPQIAVVKWTVRGHNSHPEKSFLLLQYNILKKYKTGTAPKSLL